MPLSSKILHVLAAAILVGCLPAAPASAQVSSLPAVASEDGSADQAPLELDDGWSTVKPSVANLDPAALGQLTKAIQSGVIGNIHAVLVEHDGRLVYERYFSGPDERWGRDIGTVNFDRDTLHDLRSITKSVTSALLGIALGGKHREALDRPIISYFPDLQSQLGTGVQGITLKHVLTMTSGLDWNEMTVPYTSADNDEIRLYYTTRPVAMVLGRPVRGPVGEKWYYNGGLAQVVAGLIRRETGLRLDTFAQRELFEPLGIEKFEWLGSPKWSRETSPSAASGLRLRARDLAKFGSIFLRQGTWNGRQVVPADWVELSTQTHVDKIPWGRRTGSYGYGFMWYSGVTLNHPKYRLVRAAGNGNQRIFILPQLRLAITILAGSYNDFSGSSDADILNRIIEAAGPNSPTTEN